MSLRFSGKSVSAGLAFLGVVFLLSFLVLADDLGGGTTNTAGQGVASGGSSYNEGLFMEMCKAVTFDMVRTMAMNPTIYNATASPPIPMDGYQSITRLLLRMIVPPFEILIILTAIYIIYVSMIPRKRAYAKNYLTRLIVGMVLVALSPVIFQVMLEIEHVLFMQMMTSGTKMTGGPCEGLSDAACFEKISALTSMASCALLVFPFTCTIGIVVIAVALLSYAVVWLRLLVVTGLGIIFPATVFLYMWNYTQGIGKKLMKYTFMWVFMPLVSGLFIVIMATSLSNFTFTAQAGIMVVGGYLGIMLSPLIVTGLMKVAGGATVLAAGKFQSEKMAIVGGLMMGYGPSAFSMGASMAGARGAGLKKDGGSYGGVGMAKDRPSMGGIGGIRGAYRAIRGGEGGLAAVTKGIFGAAGGAVSGARRAAFEGAWKQMTGRGMGIGTRMGGFAKVVGLPIGHMLHAKILYPAGTMLTGMFHERTDLAPQWISKHFNAVGMAFMGVDGEGKPLPNAHRPIRNAFRGVGKTLGVVDSETGRIRVGKLAFRVGIGLALFTPMGNVAILGIMGATVGGGFVFGRGLSLKGVVEGYGAARGAGRGVIMSAWEGMRNSLSLQQLWADVKLNGLTGFTGLVNVRRRIDRALSGTIGAYDEQLRNIHSEARLAYDSQNDRFQVIRPGATPLTPQNIAAFNTLENEMNANITQNRGRVGALLNRRNDLDADITRVQANLSRLESARSTVEGMAYGQQVMGDPAGEVRALELKAQEELAGLGLLGAVQTGGNQGFTVVGVNALAAAQGITPDQVLQDRMNGFSGMTQAERTARLTEARTALTNNDDIAMRIATGRVDQNLNAATIYSAAEADIRSRFPNYQPNISLQSQLATLSPAERADLNSRLGFAAEAITGNQTAQAKRAASAESAALQNQRRLGVRELGDNRDVINAELQRVGVLDNNGNQLRGPASEREHSMVNALGQINGEFAPRGLTVKQVRRQLAQEIRSQRESVRAQNPNMSVSQSNQLARQMAIDQIITKKVGGSLNPAELTRRRGEVEAVLTAVGRGPITAQDDLNMITATGRSAAEMRDLRRLRPLAEYMDTHAQWSLTAVGETELRTEKEALQARADVFDNYERIVDGLPQIFALDEARQGHVDALLGQALTGNESPQVVARMRKDIDESLQNLGRAAYLDTQITPLQGSRDPREIVQRKRMEDERDSLREKGTRTLPVKIDPTTNTEVQQAIHGTQQPLPLRPNQLHLGEVERNRLLDERVVNTHQMLPNQQGELYHVSDANTTFGQNLQGVDLAKAAQGMDAQYTVQARELYDYATAADQTLRLTAKEEVFRDAARNNSSPDIAYHLQQGDRTEYVAVGQGQTGDWTLNQQTGGYDHTPGQGTHNRVMNERWISTVDGLSDQQAYALSEVGDIKTRDEFMAAMQGLTTNAQGVIMDPTTKQPFSDPNTNQPVTIQGAVDGEHAICDKQGNWTTIEQVAGTAGADSYILDAANEGMRQVDWRREQVSVERQVAAADDAEGPMRRKLNALRDEIEGVPKGEA